ncbi:MAG TPA: condensation domain-containing protein, partial [Thermoanaerobaculia bacterium]
ALGEGDDRRLIAYVVPAVEDDLRTFLRSRLPEYMVPSAFVFLDALPLTPNRKIDRKALPEPAREEREEVELSPLEELLAAIWSEVLGVERIGPSDDFFGLGGHSLKVTQVLARVREAFGVELPVRSLFESPTLAGLAARIEEASGSAPAAPPLVRVPRDGDLPLSFAQERLWFLHRLAPESPAYNMPAALRLSGDLDPAALERVLQEIVRRHETLRTTFPETDGEPRQRVHPFQAFALPVIDLPEALAPDTERLIREEAARPFDLRQGPLLRALLLRLGEREWIALFCLHHVISDGWSMGVLVRETAALYAGGTLPELPVQYADFAVWQRGWLQGEVLASQVAWWREALADAPAVIDLPLDRPRSPGSGPAGIAKAKYPAAALRELGRREGATLFMVLLAAFQAVLHRLTGEDDVVVGTPIAGRTHAGLEGLIGFFVNTLALRSRLDGEPTFRELLARSRATALGAYAHQDLPFERLVEELRVERSLHHAPVFQVMLVLQNAPMAELALPGLALSSLALASGTAKFELSLSAAEDGSMALEYDARLFDEATAARLLERLGVLFEGAVHDPERLVSELPVMGEAERRQVLEWSAPPTAPPTVAPPILVHRRFEEWAKRSPGAIAVGSTTYGELDRTASRLARDLRAAGAGAETRVAVSTNRPEGWPLALLAVLKAGAVYVPLDPKLPAERLDLLLADSGAAVMLADEALLGRAGGLRGVCLDRVSRFGPETFSPVEIHPESLAYVIYTSGSTGVPKAVGVPHGALAAHMSVLAERFGLGPGDRLLGAHADGFDASMEQMLLPLVSGAALFPRGGELWSVPGLVERIERWGITVAQMPTAYWRQLVEELAASGRTLAASLRLVEAGGEAMPVESARLWPRVAPGARLLNGYGPTETVITPTFFEVEGEVRETLSGSVPIGRPVARTARVVDRHGRPVPIGVAGELRLGTLLARGYL